MATSNVARSSSNNSMATTAQDNDGNLPPTFAETLVTEVFRPGVSPMTFTILNYSLVGLILVLFWLALQGNFNIHVAIVTFLASGLLLVVNWYRDDFLEAARMAKEQEKIEQEQQQRQKTEQKCSEDEEDDTDASKQKKD